jgi:predicted DNA-binding transcriptional regulator AlpA
MDSMEQTLRTGGVLERRLPRQATTPLQHQGQQQSTGMSELEVALTIEPGPTGHGGPALVPATMTIAQAAAYIGIAKSTLYTWRTRRPGFGPRAVKAGGALRYRRSDLEAWIDAHTEALDLAPELDPDGEDQDSRRDEAVASRTRGSMSRRSRARSR